MKAIDRWREFEAWLRARELQWTVNYAPADLRWARRAHHPLGSRYEHLLPADYRAFVAAVGYPVFDHYQNGFAFLPPEPMAVLSPGVWDPEIEDDLPEPADGEPAVCHRAFFCGIDLADIAGYGLDPDGVWIVDNATADAFVGTFAEWLDDELTKQQEWIDAVAGVDFSAIDRVRDDDQRRLLGYSLCGTYDQAPYSAADLELTWVKGGSYSYGLIDASGTWRIPVGKQFREVRPFRDGVAEVVAHTDDPALWHLWRRIDTTGAFLT